MRFVLRWGWLAELGFVAIGNRKWNASVSVSLLLLVMLLSQQSY